MTAGSPHPRRQAVIAERGDSDRYWTTIRTIVPNPIGGGPNPKFDTYSAPSGPNVMPVGKKRFSAMIVAAPDGSIRTTRPVLGVGSPGAVIDSST